METPLPDHDFNNGWGTVLGVTELQHRPIATSWMHEYWKDPLLMQRKYKSVLAEYINKFEYGLGPTPNPLPYQSFV
jgi:hypothetical protein